MKQQKFSLFKRFQSFKYAFNGCRVLFSEEHNARIHAVAALLAVALSVTFKINSYEWIAVIFSIGLVVVAETINSAIENICDFISPGRNDKIKKIKDLSAAAVLLSAITALVIGMIIFLPKIFG